MNELVTYSYNFFLFVMGLSLVVHVVRTSPLIYSNVGISKITWREWLADQIISRLGIERESFLARSMKLISIITKYGLSAWALLHIKQLDLVFWILVWATLLIVEIMRKTAQFYIPVKWENVSLKLDSEHFWLINLVLLGVVELNINTTYSSGLVSLLIFYILFSGEPKSSILAAIEDVVSVVLALVSCISVLGVEISNIEKIFLLLASAVLVRSIVRKLLGRAWIKRKFWWIAQFCLMTALIIKSMEVLGAWTFIFA